MALTIPYYEQNQQYTILTQHTSHRSNKLHKSKVIIQFIVLYI